jgi:Pyruvate/2-oxoacid:ferredoxin oxidoreductase delta subunit
VQTYIDKNDSIAVGACYCRHKAELVGEDTHGMPTQVCMTFGKGADFVSERLGGRKLTRDEARDLLDQAEEAGLVHMSRNITDSIEFMCNCDRWHCGAIGMMLKQPKPGVFFNSGFEPQIDADECTACDICIERCPPEALAMGDDDVPRVDLDRCFGCAVCATGCPVDAIAMVAKPGFPEPPKDNEEFGKAMKAAYS